MFQGPEPDDIFFGIVTRGSAMVMIKDIGVDPVPDPDALAEEFSSRGVGFWKPVHTNSDNLRGFEVQDPNGYVLYFGRPLLD